jgi:hypothetical protein
MKDTVVRMKIADILIEMRSRFPLEKLSREELKGVYPERFQNFYTKSKKRPDIRIAVQIASTLPDTGKAKRLFVMWRKPDRRTNWQLWKSDKGYVFKYNVRGNKHVAFISESFDKAVVHLLPSKEKGFAWYPSDIIYDFMQVLLIHYIARNNLGFFIHCAGIRDARGAGYIFAGKSEAGKTTLSRILYDSEKVKVLNDDRVALRKVDGKYYIYGIPWHGEFTDYMKSYPERSVLRRVYFIRHDIKNSITPLPVTRVFRKLYPTVFLPFWDKEGLNNISSFCADLVSEIPTFDMGFIKSDSVAEFVMKANREQ